VGKGATIDAQEFWSRLEYRVGDEIAGLSGDEFRGVWCDGFIPDTFDITGGQPMVRGRVWLARSGYRGTQEEWRFTLLLPESVRGEEDVDWAAILPPDDVTGWLSLDTSRRVMKVNPAAAYPDRQPATE
jgi:hypothetical protein